MESDKEYLRLRENELKQKEAEIEYKQKQMDELKSSLSVKRCKLSRYKLNKNNNGKFHKENGICKDCKK